MRETSKTTLDHTAHLVSLDDEAADEHLHHGGGQPEHGAPHGPLGHPALGPQAQEPLLEVIRARDLIIHV